MKRPELTLADRVDAKSVGRLLCAQGWEEFREFWDDAVVYRRPASENSFAEILLPKKRGDDYALRLLNAARSLAEYEHRSVEAVLFDWKNPEVDRVRCRIASPQTLYGSASLKKTQEFLAGLVSTLRVAVKDATTPAPFHKRVRSAEIDELLETAEFGQTERGSFVVNIYAPLGSIKDAERFEATRGYIFRSALEGLMRTLNAAVASVEDGSGADFLNRDENRNVSGNLFDALADASGDDTDATLDICVDWSPLLPVSKDVPSSARITRECVEYFRTWARERRPKDKNALRREFIGQVRELAGEERDDDDRPFGDVALLIFDEERNFEARARLNSDEYETALDSHRWNRYVAFNGECVWEKGKAAIVDTENFRAIERESQRE